MSFEDSSKLEEELKNKEKLLQNKHKELIFFKNIFADLEELLNKKNNELINLKKINEINKKDLKNSSMLIKELKLNNNFNSISDNFEEFLIRQYNNPNIFPPFDKIDKSNFLFMEIMANYLVSIAENLDNKPLISVIMPVYNRKDIVMKSIESVLSQSYENFELIIVDDASTDGTRDLLREFNHEKVKIIFHDENKFCAGARNTGLNEANGEFISYLDSDNLFDRRYLAAVVGAFSILPNADAVYTAQYRFDNFNQNPSSILFGVFNKSLLFNSNYIDVNAFSHRKSVYESIGGFDERYDALEDWDLILRMVNEDYKIYSIPVLLSLYYMYASNRTSNFISMDYINEISENNQKNRENQCTLSKKVSIVIPVYKSDFNIENCVESILSLNIEDIEIIISNNCSNVSLREKFKDIGSDLIKIVESKSNRGFSDALNQGLTHIEKDSDVLILNQTALLKPNSLGTMQKYAYELKDCGLVVSQEILKDSKFIYEYLPYVGRLSYGCDISTSKMYDGVFHVPIFHNGEIIEMKFSTFFCTYVKNDVLEVLNDFNFDCNDASFMKLFSQYLRNVERLKIYHVSDAFVINNLGTNYELMDCECCEFNFDYMWNF